jgi:hypothetical protein
MKPQDRFSYIDAEGRGHFLAGSISAGGFAFGIMPALIYRWYFRAHGVRGLERSVLRFSGMAPIRETLLGMVDAAGDAKRWGKLDGWETTPERLTSSELGSTGARGAWHLDHRRPVALIA